MSKTTFVVMKCDVPGPHQCGNAGTVTVSLDGDTWESEMCPAGEAQFAAGLHPFIAKARKAGKPKPARTVADRRASAAIRTWAWDQGYAIGPGGALPKQVLAAYRAAHRDAGKR